MLTRKLYVLFLVTAGLVCLSIGCSDNSTSSSGGGSGSSFSFANFDSIVEDVAPPQFSEPSLAPGTIDSFWYVGEYALLGKVFGPLDNTSLYRNVSDFEETLDIIEEMIEVDDAGQVVTGEFGDSASGFVMTVSALEDPVSIPEVAQVIMDASYDLDYVIAGQSTGESNYMGKVAFKIDSLQQTILSYGYCEEATDYWTSSLTLASLDLTDSTFIFEQVFYGEYGEDGERPSWVFKISSTETGDFQYSMGWYSDDLGDGNDLYAAIIGGGNKDVEFALKYNCYVPADSSEPSHVLEQVFGPNYTEGTSLITEFSEYVDDALFFPYSYQPKALIPDPWAEK